jgi:biopolymer transport protein ExbB
MFPALDVMARGGVMIWIIAALSVLTLAMILWKIWRLLWLGAWGGSAAEAAVARWRLGNAPEPTGGGLRLRVVLTAIAAMKDAGMSETAAREETERVARRALAEARQGLRLLDVIATVAPLLGLLGTVIGMIAAFQALQSSGARADPSILAGGIWQALLTTAAGMGVAIPASMSLAWFESVIDRVAADMEDLATQIFLASPRTQRAAE